MNKNIGLPMSTIEQAFKCKVMSENPSEAILLANRLSSYDLTIPDVAEMTFHPVDEVELHLSAAVKSLEKHDIRTIPDMTLENKLKQLCLRNFKEIRSVKNARIRLNPLMRSCLVLRTHNAKDRYAALRLKMSVEEYRGQICLSQSVLEHCGIMVKEQRDIPLHQTVGSIFFFHYEDFEYLTVVRALNVLRFAGEDSRMSESDRKEYFLMYRVVHAALHGRSIVGISEIHGLTQEQGLAIFNIALETMRKVGAIVPRYLSRNFDGAVHYLRRILNEENVPLEPLIPFIKPV